MYLNRADQIAEEIQEQIFAGSFKDGVQVGIWTTYDAKGKSYKQTQM